MEKVTLKFELEKEDVSAMFRLCGGKLYDKLWDEIKGKEYTMESDHLEVQPELSRITINTITKKIVSDSIENKPKIRHVYNSDEREIYRALKEMESCIKLNNKPFMLRFSTIMEKQQQQREELRRIKEERDKGI